MQYTHSGDENGRKNKNSGMEIHLFLVTSSFYVSYIFKK
jgi:hypothetical protein